MSKDSDRRVHICQVVLNLQIGGTERLVETMVRRLADRYQVSVICLDDRGTLGESLAQDGFQVAACDRRPGIDWSVPRKIAAFVKKNGVDLCHCHHYSPWFYAVLARCLAPRTKIIFTEHGGLDWHRRKFFRQLFNRLMSTLTNRITAVSPAVRDLLIDTEKFPSRKIDVVYNGIDGRDAEHLPDRQTLRRMLQLEEKAEYFILVAAFRPVKAISDLIHAFRIVVDQRPNARLILVGDGELRDDIDRQIRSLELQELVHLPGFQSNVLDWLAASDVFVLCSTSEATSVSLIESMAAGIPAVATNVGGNPYVVDDGNTAMLVPASDPKALSEAMLQLLRDANKRCEMGSAARARFQKMFELDTMLDAYSNLYETLLPHDGNAEARQ